MRGLIRRFPSIKSIKKILFNRDSGGIYSRLANAGSRQAMNTEEYGEYLENSSYPDLMLDECSIGSEFTLYQEIPLNGIAYLVFRKLN